MSRKSNFFGGSVFGRAIANFSKPDYDEYDDELYDERNDDKDPEEEPVEEPVNKAEPKHAKAEQKPEDKPKQQPKPKKVTRVPKTDMDDSCLTEEELGGYEPRPLCDSESVRRMVEFVFRNGDERMKNALGALIEENEAFRSDRDAANAAIADGQREMARIKAQQKKLGEQLSERNQALNDVLEKIEAVIKENADLTEAVAEKDAQIERMIEREQEKDDRIHSLNDQISDLQHQVTALQNQNADLQLQLPAQKKIFYFMRSDKELKNPMTEEGAQSVLEDFPGLKLEDLFVTKEAEVEFDGSFKIDSTPAPTPNPRRGTRPRSK